MPAPAKFCTRARAATKQNKTKSINIETTPYLLDKREIKLVLRDRVFFCVRGVEKT